MTQVMNLPTSLNEVALPEQLPPIVIMAFTRPDLLQKVLDALATQTLQPSKILAYIDGARGAKDEAMIQACIDLLHQFSATIPVEIIARPHNLGCDRNVIAALTEVLAQYPSMVYLEDDVVPNPGFYDRMCRLLNAYRHHERVFSLSAYANFPDELEPLIDSDFIVSNRVFALGFATWADRWQAIDLANKPPAYNPFGEFYQIPATLQNQYAMAIQFFNEKNKETDWVITMTLAALHQGYVHIIPTQSFVYNIGFGHPESVHYSAPEPAWANARYQAAAHPDRLPRSLDLLEPLVQPVQGIALVKHFRHHGLWLTPKAVLHFLKQSRQWQDKMAWLTLFVDRFVVLLRRWKSGLSV
jgi:hypothetical protein